MKLPANFSGAKAIAALQRLGFTKLRHNVSHVRLRKGTHNVTVSCRAASAPKVLQNVLRQAGVTMEQFLAQL